MTSNNARRLQFDLDPERLEDLDRVMGQCGFASRKDLVNNAISLLEWAVEEATKGKSIGSFDQESQRLEVIRMLPLETAARKARTHKQISSAPDSSKRAAHA